MLECYDYERSRVAYGGFPESFGPQRADVSRPVEGHEARDARKASGARHGIPLPASPKGPAGETRYGISVQEGGHLRPRLFLASALGMQACPTAEVSFELLEVQARG